MCIDTCKHHARGQWVLWGNAFVRGKCTPHVAHGAQQTRAKTHRVFFIQVRTLLDELLHHFGTTLLHRIKERVLAAVLTKHRLHFLCCDVIERSFAVLRGTGMSACIVWGCVRAWQMHISCRTRSAADTCQDLPRLFHSSPHPSR